MSKDVTMRDIAKELNISAVSVSKAISGREGVSDDVRAKIIAKANEMGYKYTSPKLNMEKHYNFGVLVSQAYISDSAFYSKLFQNLAIEFGKKQHSCTLEIVSHKDEKTGNLPGNVIGKRMDGVIVMGPLSAPCMEKILRIDMPILLLDNYTPEANMDCIVSDSVYGSHMLTDYLIMKGHRKIAFVGTVNATNSIMDRYLGYIKSLMQNNIPVRNEYIIPDRNEEGVIVDAKLPKDMPDAFVCNCDETAYHLVNQLSSMGVKVPEKVSVVGFDDYIYATVCTPQLTTFRVDMESMSRTAVDTMIDKLNNRFHIPGRHVISGDIVIRDSVKDLR
ncbi:MAG: LacI family DNA-binding transcriptional regulator [Lachnospiraceae bacterium]|nr:LacI family DNA-binding transcriptional regulator [Lachnospiraceae bacterium]